MENQEELELLINTLTKCGFEACRNCVGCSLYLNCQKLVAEGFGNKKQAIVEFIEAIEKKKIPAYAQDKDSPDEIAGFAWDMVTVDDIEDTFYKMYPEEKIF